jgi:hypothetical protein
VNLVVRLTLPAFTPEAALVSRGDVSLGADVHFSADSASGAGCETIAGPNVVLAPGAQVHRTNDASNDSVSVETRGPAADSTRYLLAGDTWSKLARRPGVVVAPGDTAVAGGGGQGVWLIGGRLRIAGPFTFIGLIVARGGVEITGTGTLVRGSVLSYADASGQPSAQLRGATLRFSACAVLRALERAAPPRPVIDRAWAELF